MKNWNDLKYEERIDSIKNFDSIYMELYNKAKNSNLSDKQFSLENKEHSLKLVELYCQYGAKPNFNNLTNSNLHFLVKMLNHLDFFKIPKDAKVSLEKLRLID